MFEAWGRGLYRSRRLVLVICVLFAVAAGVWGTGVFGKLTAGNTFTPAAQCGDGRVEVPPGDRRELIAGLAGHGMTSRQIAARLGVSDERVRQIARAHQITIRADAVAGRRRLDSTRIAREAVHALEGLAMSVQLADLAEIDPAPVPEWTTSLARSLRALSRFARQLKEVHP